MSNTTRLMPGQAGNDFHVTLSANYDGKVIAILITTPKLVYRLRPRYIKFGYIYNVKLKEE